METFGLQPERQGADSYFVDQNIRRARNALRTEDLPEAEKTEMRRTLQQAESASQTGSYFYARRLTADVMNNLQNTEPPEGSSESGAQEFTPEMRESDIGTRTYQDASPDSGVSFQTPTKLNEYQAPIAIKAHEGEHVRRERFKAMQEGKSVVTTQVRYQFSIDDKGRRYMAGGQTIVRKRNPIDYSSLANLPEPKISIKA